MRLVILFAVMASLMGKSAEARGTDWRSQIETLVKNGGVCVAGEAGETLYALNADKLYIPASTAKIATASAALHLLGEDYRFPTYFYVDESQNLWVKGSGDPLLVSEELALIARRLRDKGLKRVNHLYLDDSFFTADIKIPGASQSLNPYDAKNGALLANFNTLYIIKTKSGVVSAEPQTPMTLLTQALAAHAPRGKSRINLAAYPGQSLLYVGHLIKAFLEREDTPTSGEILTGRVPHTLAVFYEHRSSKALGEVLRGLLEFSTNFTANQVYLHMGAILDSPPASLEKSNRIMSRYLREQVGLTQVIVEEGSGLSRHNAFTAREMVKLLSHFSPHATLLKEKKGVWAKTGTLRGVSGLAGYFPSKRHGLVRFAILLNQGENHREDILQLLEKGLGE